jgi:hypothetical protein
MLKLAGTGRRGKRFVILGLSRMNCTKLLEGLPIHIHAEELGIGFDITIMAGETEEAMAQALRDAGVRLPEPERPKKQ